MKIIKILIVIMTILSTVGLAQGIDEPYDFPLKPGMPEWKTLETHAEMLNVLQIPQDILTKMTTRSLLEICLNYPLFSDIILHDTPKTGIKEVINNFNGFAELLKRKDAYTYLNEKFLSFDPLAIDEKWSDVEKGVYTFKLMKIELLLAQDVILESTSYESKVSLLKEALLKYEKMLTQKEYYDIFHYEQTFFLMGKILLRSGNSDLSSSIVNSKEIFNFLETGKLANYDIINEILSIANRVINQKGENK
jgi:hypothetical protein